MQRLTSILLTILILLSQSGISMASHYCEGQLVESAIGFGHTEVGCGMGNRSSSSDKKDQNGGDSLNKNCCNDIYVDYDLDDEFKSSGFDVQKTNIKQVAVLVSVYLNKHVFEDKDQTDFTFYSPPLIKQDTSILFQVFLI